MSEPSQSFEGENEGPEVEGAELQFDQAEPAAPAPSGPTCAACNRPIEDQYFEINGKVICTSCRQHIEASLRGGSGLARLLKASLFGLGAAILGAVIYFAFVKATDANWSLVAILVGFMVGGAVRKGTGNRGGLLYQILALLLTYFAIGLMGAALELESAIKEPGKNDDGRKAAPGQAAKDVAKKGAEPNTPVVAPDRRPVAEEKTDAVTPKKQEGAGAQQELPQNVGPVTALLLLSAVFAFVTAASPVYHAIQSPISGLIYGFALWEAWRLNKRAQFVFNGPYQVSQGGSGGSGLGVTHDGK